MSARHQKLEANSPLVKAEQAIARYGTLEAAIKKSGLPARELRAAWRRIQAACTQDVAW
jgi:hypothetical protein